MTAIFQRKLQVLKISIAVQICRVLQNVSFTFCSYNNCQHDALFLNFILVKNSTCFGQSYSQSSGVLITYSQQLVFVMLVMLTVC